MQCPAQLIDSLSCQAWGPFIVIHCIADRIAVLFVMPCPIMTLIMILIMILILILMTAAPDAATPVRSRALPAQIRIRLPPSLLRILSLTLLPLAPCRAAANEPVTPRGHGCL